MSLKAALKSAMKHALLPKGERPLTIRGGALRGRRMMIDLHVDTQVWRGVYERSLQRWLAETVCPESVCFDVGAAEGWATLQMALLAPRGRVYAFEPSRRGEAVTPNLALNRDVPLGEVTLERCYAGDSEGVTPDGVRKTSLDAYVESHGISRLDVLKIDVDGPEVGVLVGAAESVGRFRPAIAVETHSKALTVEVVALLESWSYSARVEEPPRHEHRPIDYNPTVFSLPK